MVDDNGCGRRVPGIVSSPSAKVVANLLADVKAEAALAPKPLPVSPQTRATEGT